jgi:hypothetical protein
MKRRSLFLSIAAGLLVSGISARDARASNVPLPTGLESLLPAGATATVVGAETLTFSNFTFSSTSTPPGSEASPANIQVSAFTSLPNETGISFTGTLNAPINTLVDVAISYIVTAPAGQLLTDAFLGSTGGPNGGVGTGTYSIQETLVNPLTGATVSQLLAGSSSPSDTVTFGGVQSILVTKDISIMGGSTGETLSFVQQAFSSTGGTTTPEPASWALLGIGMTGFLAFRRLFKKHAVA